MFSCVLPSNPVDDETDHPIQCCCANPPGKSLIELVDQLIPPGTFEGLTQLPEPHEQPERLPQERLPQERLPPKTTKRAT